MDVKNEIITILESLDITNISLLVDDINHGKLDYFTSPASSNNHLAIKGGLALHSYNVYLVMKDMNDKYNLGLSKRFIAITSLLHDICKCNVYHENILKTTGKISEAKPYTHDDKFPVGHGDKSVIMIMKYGIKLTDDEIMAIRHHNGPYGYDMTNWNYVMNTITDAGYRTQVMALHLADMIASQLLEHNDLYFTLYKSL